MQNQLWNKLKGGKQDLCRQTRFELKGWNGLMGENRGASIIFSTIKIHTHTKEIGSGKASLKKWHLNGDLKDKQELFWRRVGRSIFQLKRQHYVRTLQQEKNLDCVDQHSSWIWRNHWEKGKSWGCQCRSHIVQGQGFAGYVKDFSFQLKCNRKPRKGLSSISKDGQWIFSLL